MDSANTVLHSFLVGEGGILLASRDLSTRPAVDEDVFSAALEAIQHFMRVTFPVMEGRQLRTLGYEDFRILIEKGRHCCLVLVVEGAEPERWRSRMREALHRFEGEHAGALAAEASSRLAQAAKQTLNAFFARRNPETTPPTGPGAD